MRDESKVHFSQVDAYFKCPRYYKYRYVDNIQMQKVNEANDPLLIGTTAHLGHETDYKTAERFYLSNFMVIDNKHVNELIKIEHWIKQVKEFFQGFKVLHVEYNIETDDYQGQIDVITESDVDGYVDIWDLKYSNNDQYYDGTQLNIYDKFLTLTTDMKVKHLNYLFMPKTFIRQRNDETIDAFRYRMRKEIENQDIRIIPVKKSDAQIKRFAQRVMLMQQDEVFEKCVGDNCKWCEYQKICNGEEDYLMLPKNERVDRRQYDKLDKWIIGASYSGKSTFMDQFDDVLFCNTDGNIDQITSPVIRIKDEIWKEGRMTKKKLAWEQFKDVVTELETNHDHGFKKICLDLIEDLMEHCRIYKFKDLNIEHESDAGFGKGWDIIRTEFLSTIKRLKNIGLEVTYISKSIEKQVNLKGGASVTTYLPNIPDKVANVLAGTVGATFLIEANGSDRYLTCDQSPYHFRGTRYNLPEKIELNKDKYLVELEKALKSVVTNKDTTPKVEEDVDPKPEPKTEKQPRQSRTRKAEEISDDELPEVLQAPKATRKSYFHHPESDSVFIVEKGEVLPEDPLCEKITKKEYDELVEKYNPSEPVEEPKQEEKTEETTTRRRRKPRS